MELPATEMWVVTPDGVGDSLPPRLDPKPVQLIGLSRFLSLIENLKATDKAADS